jgi:hypothetical protein
VDAQVIADAVMTVRDIRLYIAYHRTSFSVNISDRVTPGTGSLNSIGNALLTYSTRSVAKKLALQRLRRSLVSFVTQPRPSAAAAPLAVQAGGKDTVTGPARGAVVLFATRVEDSGLVLAPVPLAKVVEAVESLSPIWCVLLLSVSDGMGY